MANDTIRIKFNVDGADAANRELAEKDRLIKQIEQSAIRLGTALGRVQIDGLRGQSLSALREGVNQFKDMERNAQRASDAIHATKVNVDNLNASLAATVRQNQALRSNPFSGQTVLGGNFDVASRDASTRGGGGAGGNASLLGRFNTAAQDIDKATASTKKLNVEIGRVHGTSEIGASAFSLLGVRGGESISLLIRQVKEMGLTLDQVLKNPTLGFIALAGGAIIFGRAVSSVASEIGQLNESLLQATRFTSQLNLKGLTGGASERSRDLEELRRIRREIQQLSPEDTARSVGQALGDRASDAEISKLRREFDAAIKRRQIFGIDTSFLGIGRADSTEVSDAFRKLTFAKGGIATEGDIDVRIRKATEEVNKFQLALLAAGDRDNIFDTAARSLKSLARETGAISEVRAFLDSAKQQASQGELDQRAFQQRVDAFQEQLQERSRQQGLERAARESQVSLDTAINFQTADAERQIAALERAVSNNPLEKLFSDASEQMRQFRNQFTLVAPDLVDRFRKANDEILQLGIFKGDLSERINLRKLDADIRRLQAAPAPGEDPATRQLSQLLLDSRFGRTGEQQAELDRLSREQAARTLERDIRSAEIDALNRDLQGARGADAQRFVLDRLLDATSNIAELNSGERDLRLKALQQRLALGEAERHRVLIQIDNNATDVASVTQNQLGPEPSPDFGNGFFDSFNQTASGLNR